VAADPTEHAKLAAELMARAIAEAVATRGTARVALSGGTTPSETYRHLAKLALPWQSIDWFWVDERAVPPDSPRSNFRAAHRDLGLASGATPAASVHRMEAEDPDLVGAAARYEHLLRRTFGVASAVAFDVVTSGVGEDGHTASLFPRTGAVGIDDRLVAAITSPPSGLEPRMTLTAPVLREARLTLVLARGAAKRPVVEAARSPGSEDEIPSRLYQSASGRVVWLLDRDAAGSPKV
jgi:6-phosphogluconolactonase